MPETVRRATRPQGPPERLRDLSQSDAIPDQGATDLAQGDGAQHEQIRPSESKTDTHKSDIQAEPDAEVRYTDAEILGKRYPVRKLVREAGNKRITMIESAQAKWKNGLDTPAKMRLGLSQSIAQSLFNRHQRRLEEVGHLPENSRLRKRREAKFAKASQRLNRTKAAYEAHTQQMTNRTESVSRNAERRRAEYLQELRSRRERALARKTMRRELRSQGASRLEARSIIKDIPKAHMHRVGNIAATAAASERFARKAAHGDARAAVKERRATKHLNENLERSQRYAEEAKRATDIAHEISEKRLPAAKEHIARLQTQLSELSRDDPTYADLQLNIEETRSRIDDYVQRELPYWQSEAERNRKKVANLTAKRLQLQSVLRGQKGVSASAAETSNEKRAVADAHATKRDDIAREASMS